MTHRYHHTHIKARDPRASARWWAEMFGATLLPEIEFGSMLMAPIELDGVRINISIPGAEEAERTRDPAELPHWGLEHIGVITEDLDADLARFAEQGLEIYERRAGAGGFDVAFVAAPDGVCVELLQPLIDDGDRGDVRRDL